ncbi:MAG: ATP phosphoribosyltransferase regulatory subunit, partial [Acidobacteria bacterium]|nr:ATP phosphoribosyltransferase regulatory subunit [Acidobacteriota bacterium]
MTNRMARPNLPRGVQAFLFEAAARRRSTEESALRVLTEAGLREVLLPVLDFAAPYAGVTVEGDEHVYRFLDRSGDLLALRADFTPRAARVLAPRLPLLGRPLAICYRGDVVRDEEAGVGRPREFAQVGAEWYGVPGFEAEETMLTTLLACLSGLPAARLRVTLGFAGLLPALLSAVAPSLAKRKGEDLEAALSEVRERRVLALTGRLLSGGAAAAAAREIARSLLVGFDPGSPLFSQPVLRG